MWKTFVAGVAALGWVACRWSQLGKVGMARRFFVVAAAAVLALAACGGDGDSSDTTSSSVDTTTTVVSTTTTAAVFFGEARLAAAEAFVDAFYSFDSAALTATLPGAASSIPFVTYYQGWAEGGNYEVVNRTPCVGVGSIYSCRITVKDDLARALNLDFDVTDTFSLFFSGEEITEVRFDSDDPELVDSAFDWLFGNRPELFDGVCAGFFEGGPTPGECVQAVVEGFEDFAASDAFQSLMADASGAAATGGTPLPDVAGAVLGDDGVGPLPLGTVSELPDSHYLNFLFELCFDADECFRDAVFMDPNNPDVEIFSEEVRAFHVRHGFINNGEEPLGEGFDVVLFVFPMEEDGPAIGPTSRYTSDYVLRGTSEQCGPTYRTQTGPETCEWFVHDFPDGLTGERFALWAVWEAPCSAWLELGFTESCENPSEAVSLFSSGVDSPFDEG